MITRIPTRYQLSVANNNNIIFETADGKVISTFRLSHNETLVQDLYSELFHRMLGAPLIWMVAYQKEGEQDIPTLPLPVPYIPSNVMTSNSPYASKGMFAQVFTYIKNGFEVFFTETPHVPRSGVRLNLKSATKPTAAPDEHVHVKPSITPSTNLHLRKEF